MCIGLPAQVVDFLPDHPEVAVAELAGTRRLVNLGALDESVEVVPGMWVLVHLGYALSVLTAEEARNALLALDEERIAVAALLNDPT